ALFCNALPKFCDVSYDGNIDVTQIEKHITTKTKLIVPIDFAGNSANIKEIVEIAKKHNLLVIEDASHALGSEYHDKKVGFFADMAIYSFHAIKPITTFEGGAVACDDENLYEKLKLIRSHGITKKALWNSDMTILGYNYRLSDIASALGLNQLKKLDKFIAKREEIASFYDKTFEKNPYFYTIKIENFKKSARHLYPILLDRRFWCQKEDIFIALREKGIGVQVHYKPIYQYTYYKQLFGEQFLQNSEDFYKAEISIPCHQEMSLNDAKYVAQTLFEIFDKNRGCKT
ncbi:MAG: aminotransferase class V-fold PLP-dependent enzyme, partial [Campylobacterales bacterium]|nr:aminotransferase class V-fold PLP-dependent enzyme [Campylobacterales bacterium]